MSAITYSADGEYLFVALEDASGFQLVAKAARDNLSSWSAAYQPGAGSACNVQACVANPDVMFFYGNFGSGIQVVKHTISTGTNTNISPSGLTTKVVNALQVNPDDEDEMVISVDTDQDLKHTSDGGTTWTDWDAALGFDATALWVLWSGKYQDHRYFVAGEVASGNLDYLYSPNEGASDDNRESAGLGALANITNIEAAE